MKFVYICHPLAHPSIQINIQKVIQICTNIVKTSGKDVLPFAPHLYFPQFLQDNIEEERYLALEYDSFLIERCDEVWIFGDKFSLGMRADIKKARCKRKEIVFKSNSIEKEVHEFLENLECN